MAPRLSMYLFVFVVAGFKLVSVSRPDRRSSGAASTRAANPIAYWAAMSLWALFVAGSLVWTGLLLRGA